VDDLIIAGSSKEITSRVKTCLKRRYAMKDLGDVDEILGCKVKVNSYLGTITIQQKKYTENILEKYLDKEVSWVDTPAVTKPILSKQNNPANDTERNMMQGIPYREVIGSLLWLSLGTRPDITYAVSQVAKFSADPGPEHWQAVIRILRYLHGTRSLGITYQAGTGDPSPTIETMIPTGFVDADYARDTDTRRSCTGFMFFLSDAPISWQTRQQPSVALSTMESEFMAACAAAQESVWLIQLLKEFTCKFNDPLIIYEDNKACQDYSKNSTNHQRTKHISVRYHFIRDLIADRIITLTAIPSEDNIADIMTKPLDKKIFQRLRAKFMTVIT